jgi:hypothetical protein
MGAFQQGWRLLPTRRMGSAEQMLTPRLPASATMTPVSPTPPRPRSLAPRWLTPFLIGLCLLTAACGDDESDNTDSANSQPAPSELFSDAIERVVVEVDYAAGAAPYTGNLAGFGETWGLFGSNAAALFADKQLVVPTTLADMQALDDVNGASFDRQALRAIASRHRNEQSGNGSASYYVLFVDGFWDDGEQVKDWVLGVSLQNDGLIAMFKPVIEDLGSVPGPHVEKIVEQATLIHEFGHAIGLVNNGLAMVSDHQDDDNGVHCSNSDCVMYFEIAGRSGAMEFVQSKVKGAGNVLWGPECLDDVAAARE